MHDDAFRRKLKWNTGSSKVRRIGQAQETLGMRVWQARDGVLVNVYLF